MAQLSSKEASKSQRIMVFGAPKTGKSLIAGKLAEYFKLIWIDLENGHDVLFQLPMEWQERVQLVSIPDTRSVPMAIETCLKIVKGPVSICEQHGKVSCMICKKAEIEEAKGLEVVDAMLVHRKYFNDVDLTNPQPDEIYVFDSGTQLSNSAIANITRKEKDDYKLDYDDWGNLGKLMDIFYSHIQNSKANIVVISHEIEAQTEGKKKTLVPVAGTRNWSRNVAKYFDHVVYAETKNKKHVFTSNTLSSTTTLTGSRTAIDLSLFPGEESSSLLPIFKPDLYGAHTIPKVAPAVLKVSSVAKKEAKKSATTSKGGISANSVLAKLQQQKT